MRCCRTTFTILAVTLVPTTALAAGLHAVVGHPGTPSWANECGANQAPPLPVSGPGGPSQLAACPPGAADCLSLVTIPLTQYPNAVCNDGSPGIFYVRPGTGTNRNKWVIHTQGGGNCRSYGDCWDRWCGRQGNLPYKANKMSTDFNADGDVDLPDHVRAEGMASGAAGNDFADWSHVWMYYCSSDSWMGRNSAVTHVDPAAVGPSYTIAYRGHTILAAARAMLRPGVTADDDEITMPPLDDATDVIFSGTSAGAKGAIENVDWFLDPLTAENKYLVLDGNMDMTDQVLDLNDIWVDYTTSIGDEFEYFVERADIALAEWAPGGWYHSIDAFVDESCRVTWGAASIDVCTHMSTLLTELDGGGHPLIETESFIRVDLEDPSISDPFTDPWPGGGHLTVGLAGAPTTMAEFTVLMRQTLRELYPNPNNNVSGVFGPRCGKHVGLEETAPFALHSTPDTVRPPGGVWAAIGAPTTFHNSLVDWLLPSGQRHLDTGDVTAPIVRFSAGC